MKSFFRSKWIKYPIYLFITVFCLIGLFFTATFVGIKMKWTNDSGSVDINNRYFQEIKDKYNQAYKLDTTQVEQEKYEVLHRILLLNRFHPKNAQYILHAYQKSGLEVEALRMLDAADLMLKDNQYYQKEKQKTLTEIQRNQRYKNTSVFDWMNISEWQDFKIAVAKDKKLIDSVAQLTGVEGRLIVSCLVGEQIRLFNSKREIYKRYIGPMKVLSVETQFSFGVTGIKELTAKNIEKYLKSPNSVYYLGSEYETLLDFKTLDTATERMARLTDYRNHFYSYMYAAVFLKQVKVQWEKAGFPIDNRPEILATLFNVGFPQSKPKANPLVGGSTIKIYDKPHTFGSIAYQFYYSGELFDLFPFEKQKFDFNKNDQI